MMGHLNGQLLKNSTYFTKLFLERNRYVDPTRIVGIENDRQFRVCYEYIDAQITSIKASLLVTAIISHGDFLFGLPITSIAMAGRNHYNQKDFNILYRN
jgi:hypothetical protein